jgi:hypothetical protein
MAQFEVPQPIICSPFAEPSDHWWLEERTEPRREPGRRPAHYFYREPGKESSAIEGNVGGEKIDLPLVNLIRERVGQWRAQGWPGVTGTTLELLQYWRREGREKRLLFAQLEAAETIIFLVEARRDFVQGIEIPADEPGSECLPDFTVRLKSDTPDFLVLETKGFDELAEIKTAAAERCVAAVNADGKFGQWRYAMARSIPQVREILDAVATQTT